MFTLAKINALLLLAGLIVSYSEGIPLVDNEFEERTLDARTVSANSKCYPRRPHAAKGHSATKSKTLKTRDSDDNELVRRANHPSPGEQIMLYHGTTEDFEFNHENSPKNGDLHTPLSMQLCGSVELGASAKTTKLQFRSEIDAFDGRIPMAGNHCGQYRAWLKSLYDWTYRDPADATVPRPTAEPHIEALHNMEMLSGPMGPPTSNPNSLGNILWQYVLINPS
ncbi:hypothetical protein H0H93_003871, partial [Arthromyces matolae]